MRAVPEVGVTTPVSMEMVWVLPAPFGPSRPNTSPSSTLKLIPLTASKSPYFLTRFSTSRIAGILNSFQETSYIKIQFNYSKKGN